VRRSLVAALVLVALVLGIGVARQLRAVRELPELRAPELEPAPALVAPEGLAGAPELASAPAPAPERSAVAASEPEPAAASVPVVRVRVSDAAQRPLPGARVLHYDSLRDEDALEERTTGADGSCTLDPVRTTGERLALVVEKAGYFHELVDCERTDEVRVSLRPALVLKGRVLDVETRAALPGATVSYWHARCKRCSPVVATADAEGRYELTSVLESEREGLQVAAPSHPKTNLGLRTEGLGPVLERDLPLARGLDVQGVVRDLDTRAPLAEVTVNVGAEYVETDASGRFALSAGADGERVLFTLWEDQGCMLEAQLPAAECARPVEIPLPRARGLSGRVLTAQGAPIVGATVGASFSTPATSQDRRTPAGFGLPEGWAFRLDREAGNARSDAEGRYRLAGLVPVAGTLGVWSSAPGFRRAQVEVPVEARSGDEVALDITLEPIGAVAALHGVLTLNGEVVRGYVSWRGATRGGSSWAEKGRYRIEDAEPGLVQLSAHFATREQRLARMTGDATELRLAPGEEHEHDFALTLSLSRIAGHVRYRSGAPAAATVYAWSKQRRAEVSVETGPDGAYALEVPEGDTYFMRATSPGDTAHRRDVVAGAGDVDFVLADPATLRLRVIDADTRAPLRTFQAHWRVDGTEWRLGLMGQYAATDAEGAFELRTCACTVDVSVHADELGYRPALLLGLVAGQVSERATPIETVALERGLELRFALDPASGAWPAEHALVLVEEAAWEEARLDRDGNGWRGMPSASFPNDALAWRRLSFDGDGRAGLRGLAPGRHRFKVFPDDLVIEPAGLEVDVGTAEPIVIRWRRK